MHTSLYYHGSSLVLWFGTYRQLEAVFIVSPNEVKSLELFGLPTQRGTYSSTYVESTSLTMEHAARDLFQMNADMEAQITGVWTEGDFSFERKVMAWSFRGIGIPATATAEMLDEEHQWARRDCWSVQRGPQRLIPSPVGRRSRPRRL